MNKNDFEILSPTYKQKTEMKERLMKEAVKEESKPFWQDFSFYVKIAASLVLVVGVVAIIGLIINSNGTGVDILLPPTSKPVISDIPSESEDSSGGNTENQPSEKLSVRIYHCGDVNRTDDTKTHGSASVTLFMEQYNLELKDYQVFLCEDGCEKSDIVSRASQGNAPMYNITTEGEIDGNPKAIRFRMTIPESMVEGLKEQNNYESVIQRLDSNYYYLIELSEKHYAYIHLARKKDAEKAKNEVADADAIIKNARFDLNSDTSSVDETGSSDTESAPEVGNDSEKPDGQRYRFLPILNKEDIDYMGIPYKDLTPEQVIQMWAQCTRERNWQKRYVIEKFLQNDAEQYGCPDRIFDWYGLLYQCFYDVEISRFYTGWDDENPERKYYSITARVVYYSSLSDNENHVGLEVPESTRIITMEKTDGYWFIADIATSAPIDPDILEEMLSSDTESKVEEEKDNSKFSDPDYYLDIFGDRGYSFLPILNEDDIDYMGIPYKDLTPEQVIQMWAQCTRERNWQKRYVIEKYMYENTDDYTKLDIIFDTQQGRNGCYYDVEISDWYPEGNAENAKRLYFRINSRIVFYSHLSDNDDHVQVEQTDMVQCVELEKIDGYWRIVGVSTSGPADFDRVTDTVQ